MRTKQWMEKENFGLLYPKLVFIPVFFFILLITQGPHAERRLQEVTVTRVSFRYHGDNNVQTREGTRDISLTIVTLHYIAVGGALPRGLITHQGNSNQSSS